MMRFDGSEVAAMFQEAFGKPIQSLTPTQMRWIVNLAKHCRGRCRSNAALNSYLKRNFSHLRFDQVPVTKLIRGVEQTFDVLKISDKTGKVVAEENVQAE